MSFEFRWVWLYNVKWNSWYQLYWESLWIASNITKTLRNKLTEELHKTDDALLDIVIGVGLSSISAKVDGCYMVPFYNLIKRKYVCFSADEGVAMPCPFLGQYTYTDKGSLCRGEFKIGCKNENEVIIETECPGNQRSGMDDIWIYGLWHCLLSHCVVRM